MKPANERDVMDLLSSSGRAAALGAALELGLFPALAADWREPCELGEELGVNERRCRYWLQLLGQAGLVDCEDGRYRVSAGGRSAILDAHSPDTWRFFARSEREMQGLFHDLPQRLQLPAKEWRGDCDLPPDYVTRMGEDPAWAEEFTRMLRELHGDLAQRLAATLSGEGVLRFMDLGGGSGVMSHALLQAWPAARAVLVDIAPVTELASRIAAEVGLADRLDLHTVTDFTRDPLPAGDFDLILECDLSVHDAALFTKLAASLRPGGRLAILDQFAPAPGIVPPERVLWRFQGALLENTFETPTVAELRIWLAEAGLVLRDEGEIESNWILLVAEKPGGQEDLE
jgi:SAM-dependent methyltransferase